MAWAGEATRSPEDGAIFPSRIAPRWPSARMVGLLVGPKGPLAWAGEALRSPAWGYFSKPNSPEMAVRPDGRLAFWSEMAVGLGGGGLKVPRMGLFFQAE